MCVYGLADFSLWLCAGVCLSFWFSLCADASWAALIRCVLERMMEIESVCIYTYVGFCLLARALLLVEVISNSVVYECGAELLVALVHRDCNFLGCLSIY